MLAIHHQPLFVRGLTETALVVFLSLAMLFLGLPIQPASSLDLTVAPSEVAEGIALWANLAEGKGGLVWSASSSSADGLVHSNRDLRISGSSNSLLGGTEYGRQLRVTGRSNVIDPPATKVGAPTFRSCSISPTTGLGAR